MSRQYSDSYRSSGKNNKFRSIGDSSYGSSGNNRVSYNSYTPNYNPKNNRSTYQGNYNSNPYNKPGSNNARQPWRDAREEVKDDCIAPKHTSQSADSLQRWALATASLPQQGHHFRDTEVMERIKRRYASREENPNTPSPRHSNFIDNTEDTMSSTFPQDAKRQRSISPPLPGRSVSAVSVVRESKRQRIRSPDLPLQRARAQGEVVDLTGEHDKDIDYAQSSEWSFPDSDVEITQVRELP